MPAAPFLCAAAASSASQVPSSRLLGHQGRHRGTTEALPYIRPFKKGRCPVKASRKHACKPKDVYDKLLSFYSTSFCKDFAIGCF